MTTCPATCCFTRKQLAHRQPPVVSPSPEWNNQSSQVELQVDLEGFSGEPKDGPKATLRTSFALEANDDEDLLCLGPPKAKELGKAWNSECEEMFSVQSCARSEGWSGIFLRSNWGALGVRNHGVRWVRWKLSTFRLLDLQERREDQRRSAEAKDSHCGELPDSAWKFPERW